MHRIDPPATAVISVRPTAALTGSGPLPETTAPDDGELGAVARRPEWRQRLVQAERGFMCGLRADSTLFAHFFVWLVIFTMGLVLWLHWQQWIIVGLALSFALSAELFHQAFRALLIDPERESTPQETRVLGLATAATVIATLGAATPVITIFWQRLQHML
jgi:diacylglycerol kinase